MKRGSGNPIPLRSRVLVETREQDRCLRCGMRGSEWHHRRKRSIKDEHQHCSCNGVLLCKTCHVWAHAHPVEAKVKGFIVTQFSNTPSAWEVQAWHGPVGLSCVGTYAAALPAER